MVAELATRIKKDWLDLREVIGDLPAALSVAGCGPERLAEVLSFVRSYAVNGFFDAKQELLARIFTQVEAMGFRSLPQAELDRAAADAHLLVASTLLQREAATGRIGVPSQPVDAAAPHEGSVQDIVADISLLAKNNPALLKNPNMQNISRLLKMYQEEQQKFRDFMAHAETKERETQIKANFAHQFKDLLENIRRYYGLFQADMRRASAPVEEMALFAKVDADEMGKLGIRQLKVFLELSTAFDYVEEQRSGAPELAKLFVNRKPEFQKLLADERRTVESLVAPHVPPAELRRACDEYQNDIKHRAQNWLEERLASTEAGNRG